MLFSPGTQVKFKAAPDGPVATVGLSRMIRGIAYCTVAWTDEQGGFKSIEVQEDLLFEAAPASLADYK